MVSPTQIKSVIPDSLRLTAEERAAILEIAYLAIAADRRLSDEEVAAFEVIAGYLTDLVNGGPISRHPYRSSEYPKTAITDAELARLQERFTNGLTREEADELLLVAAKQLTTKATRAAAYQVAYALALCDLNASDEEFEFDLQLIDALELSTDDAELLAGNVVAAITPPNSEGFF